MMSYRLLALSIRPRSEEYDTCQSIVRLIVVVISTSLGFTNIWLASPLAEEAIRTVGIPPYAHSCRE